MNLEPDQLFVQSSTLIYFTGWLWLSVVHNIVPLRAFGKPMVNWFTAVALTLSSLTWCYLTLFILVEANANPFRLPLVLELILILVLAVTYIPLKPWRGVFPSTIPAFVKTARFELLGLLVVLPVLSLWQLAPFGSALIGWFPHLIVSAWMLSFVIGAAAAFVTIASMPPMRRYLLTAAILFLILSATYVVAIAALIASI